MFVINEPGSTRFYGFVIYSYQIPIIRVCTSDRGLWLVFKSEYLCDFTMFSFRRNIKKMDNKKRASFT